MPTPTALFFESLGGLARIIAVFLVCLGLGWGLTRVLRAQPSLQWRGVGAVCITLAGLRAGTWLAQVLSELGARFSVLVWIFGGLGLAGLGGMAIAVWRRREKVRFSASTLGVLVTLFVLYVAVVALFSPPTAWDLYTHWLTLPHEIVAADSLLSLNVMTNSVVPDYALHLTAVGATLKWMGAHDGWLNAVNPLVVGATLVVVNAILKLRRVEPQLRNALLLLITALLFASNLIYGFFYGDAILILGIAVSMLGLLLAARASTRPERLIAAVLLTAALVGKGYGYLIALGTCLGLLLIAAVEVKLGRRERGRRFAAVAGLGVGVLVLERFILYRLTIHPAESNADISIGGALSSLGRKMGGPELMDILQRFAGHQDRILIVASILLCLIALVFSSLRSRAWFWALPATVVLAILFISVMARPDISGSMPRYSFALAPCLVVGLGELARRASRARQSEFQLVAIAIAGATLALGEVRSYIEVFNPASPARIAAYRGLDPEALALRPAFTALAAAHPEFTAQGSRYLLLNEDYDGFFSFRLMSHLSAFGFRGHLYSETHTSRSSDRGEREVAARRALLERDAQAMHKVVEDIDLVILNAPSKPLGEVPMLLPTADFLKLVDERFSQPQVKTP